MDHSLHGTAETFDELLAITKLTYPRAKRILISANVDSLNLRERYAGDMDGFLQKPFIDFLELSNYINDILK
jgi:hypothetical protein